MLSHIKTPISHADTHPTLAYSVTDLVICVKDSTKELHSWNDCVEMRFISELFRCVFPKTSFYTSAMT